MTKLPMLYSRTSTGAVQTWQMIVEGNTFYTIIGQIDGKKTTSEPSICEGKNIGRANETSPEQQALAEAQAKWDKRKRTGYSEDVNNIDECLDYIEPMLANSLKKRIDKINWKKGVMVQNKYNGVRCIADAEDITIVLKSREGKLWLTVPHINRDLEGFFKLYPNAVLDGELYNYDLRQKLNQLIKLVRKTVHFTPEDIAKSEEMVRYYIYDGYGFDAITEDTPVEERKAWIDDNLPKHSKYYRHVNTDIAYSMEEVDKIYEKYLADGEEGAIVRILGTPYKHGRGNQLLKYKPVDDDECIILDVKPGTGNYAHRAKTSLIRWKGIEFAASWMGDEEQGMYILAHPEEYVGKTVTFKYNGLTGLGTPNYARIDPDNCFRADKDNTDE